MPRDGEPGDRWIYQTCDLCKRRDVFSFWVTDEVWAAVMDNPRLRVCGVCFDELADAKDVQYTFLAISPISWSQGLYEEWPHLDVPCAECVGRRTRQRNAERA